MEEDLQEKISNSDKKTSFLSKSINKKTLIIIICSAVCFFAVLLLFSFISSSRKSQAQAFVRPSINGPKRPPRKNVETTQQQPEQHPQMETSEQISQGQNPERKPQEYNNQRRTPRGIYKGETPEQEHQRHMREIAESEKGYDPNYRRQQMSRQKRNRRQQREQQEREQNQRGQERPRLNS